MASDVIGFSRTLLGDLLFDVVGVLAQALDGCLALGAKLLGALRRPRVAPRRSHARRSLELLGQLLDVGPQLA